VLSCRDLANHADRYLDGELSLRERLEVRLHMFLCKHCSRYVEQLRLTIETVRRTPRSGGTAQMPREESITNLVDAMHTEHCRHSPAYEDAVNRVMNAVRAAETAKGDRPPPAVIIYTTPWCPYCRRAKALLRAKHIAYHEIDVAHDSARRQEMIALAAGRRMVPQIFIGGRGIGGCDELHALAASGELDRLLSRA